MLVHRDTLVQDLVMDTLRRYVETHSADDFALFDGEKWLNQKDTIGKATAATELLLSKLDDGDIEWPSKQPAYPHDLPRQTQTEVPINLGSTIRLIDRETQQIFIINEFPARIGRRQGHPNPDEITIDLGQLPAGESVSRSHAIIRQTEEGFTTVIP